jgi:sulfate permease, SulP family
VKTVGEIPNSLPAFGLPTSTGHDPIAVRHGARDHTRRVHGVDAVAKVYARRHRYDLDPNQELVGLGYANVASGLFGGYP